MAGASGAATSTAQLQAAARGGSGLTKGELYVKPYGDLPRVAACGDCERASRASGPPRGEAAVRAP